MNAQQQKHSTTEVRQSLGFVNMKKAVVDINVKSHGCCTHSGIWLNELEENGEITEKFVAATCTSQLQYGVA